MSWQLLDCLSHKQPYSRVNNGVFKSNDGNILNPIGTAAVRLDSSVGEFFARCIPFLVGHRCFHGRERGECTVVRLRTLDTLDRLSRPLD